MNRPIPPKQLAKFEAAERRAAMFNQFLDSLARKAGGV